MTHVSQHKLSPDLDNQIRSALKETFLNLNAKDLNIIFPALITETEEIMIAKRLSIILMLSEGYKYYQISQILKVTDGTISGIHFGMNSSPEVHKFLLSKLKSWKRKKLLKAILKEIGMQTLKVSAKHAGGRIR